MLWTVEMMVAVAEKDNKAERAGTQNLVFLKS